MPMLDRSERIRRRLPRGTKEEMAQEFAEEVLKRGLRTATQALRRAKITQDQTADILGGGLVEFCAKEQVEVATLIDKITKAEKVRTDKIKEEEEKGGKPK